MAGGGQWGGDEAGRSSEAGWEGGCDGWAQFGFGQEGRPLGVCAREWRGLLAIFKTDPDLGVGVGQQACGVWVDAGLVLGEEGGEQGGLGGWGVGRGIPEAYPLQARPGVCGGPWGAGGAPRRPLGAHRRVLSARRWGPPWWAWAGVWGLCSDGASCGLVGVWYH